MVPAVDACLGLYKQKLPKKSSPEINAQISQPLREAVKSLIEQCESVEVAPVEQALASQELIQSLECKELVCERTAKLFEQQKQELARELKMRRDRIGSLYVQIGKQLKAIFENRLR